MSEIKKSNMDYIGYEYMTVHTDENKISLCMDAYGDLGWELDMNRNSIYEKNSVIYLKRDRKIINKVELTRLQRHFEDCLKQLDNIEKSKISSAVKYSVIVGLIGTVFIAGSTFAVTAQTPMIMLCIILAVPGLAGWIAPIFLYKYYVKKKTESLAPIIEEKYEEIYEICEKGRRLL